LRNRKPSTIKSSQLEKVSKNRINHLLSKNWKTNLTIATAPWKRQADAFSNSLLDAKLEKVEPSLMSHLQDLIQLYVDISLANNVVWLETEIGHRSKELDESYIKLCSGIAQRIKGIVPAINEAI